jgi:hypothetical protein
MAEALPADSQNGGLRRHSGASLVLMELWDHLVVKKPWGEDPATSFFTAISADGPTV